MSTTDTQQLHALVTIGRFLMGKARDGYTRTLSIEVDTPTSFSAVIRDECGRITPMHGAGASIDAAVIDLAACIDPLRHPQQMLHVDNT